jgi:cell division protein FtsQ
MSTKRKISVRRIMQAFITLVVVAGSVLAILSASQIQDKAKLAGIDIRIKNEQYGFIDKDEVKNLLLNNRHIDIAKTSIKKLDIRQMEDIMNANPWIANAQLYIDNKHVLHVNITQRVPVVRLFERNGNSYYLDHTLRSMPLSDKYIHYTTVVTNVPVLKDDSFASAFKAQVVALVKHVEHDSFWNAQVSQIIVTDDTTGFELVPILGEHRILFGDTSNMQQKFDHLLAFYKKVLNRIGWNKYQVLDVRFNGQVVASPALPWKKPKDNTMGNMNWVNSIIAAEPKATESDTPRTLMPATVNAVVAKAAVKPVATQTVQKPATVVPQTAKPVVPKQNITATAVKPMVKTKEKVEKPIVKPEPKTVQATAEKKKPAIKLAEQPKKEAKVKEDNKEESAPKYIYKGNENNNQ